MSEQQAAPALPRLLQACVCMARPCAGCLGGCFLGVCHTVCNACKPVALMSPWLAPGQQHSGRQAMAQSIIDWDALVWPATAHAAGLPNLHSLCCLEFSNCQLSDAVLGGKCCCCRGTPCRTRCAALGSTILPVVHMHGQRCAGSCCCCSCTRLPGWCMPSGWPAVAAAQLCSHPKNCHVMAS
jgi:hypothetical protein